MIVLEVRGIFFFQIPWTTYGRSSSLNWNITTGLFLRSSPFINRDSASSTSLHGLSGRNMLNLVRHTNLCIHNSENYMFLWDVLFSCILTLVYQLIVKSMRAFVHRCLYSCGPSSHSIAEWLGETNSRTWPISRVGSKKLCSADQIANPAFALLYLGVLPSLYQEYHGNCTPSYELLIPWYSLHHYSFLGFRVIITGMPTSESWCVKSILRATRCWVANGQHPHS